LIVSSSVSFVSVVFFFFFSFFFASFAGDDEAFNFETAGDDEEDEGEVPSTFEDAHPIASVA